jgi:PAS domain S-box-containing protein
MNSDPIVGVAHAHRSPAATRHVAHTAPLTRVGRAPAAAVQPMDGEPSTRSADGRDAMAMVTLLVGAWQGASKARSTPAALAVIARTAKGALRADSATIDLGAGRSPRASPPMPGPSDLRVPILGVRGDVIATLQVGRAHADGPFSNEDEAVAHALGLMAGILIQRDVSERNHLAVLEHSPAAIFLKDQDLRYVLANRRAAEMLGLDDPAAMIGCRDSEFLPDSEAARIMASDQAILDGAGDVDTEEDADWPVQGRRLHVHAFAVNGDDGGRTGVGGVVTDVTELRRADATAIASERQYRLLLEHALDAIVVADDDGRIIQVNPATSTLLAWSRDDLVGRKVGDLVQDRGADDAARGQWSGSPAGAHDARASRGYVRLGRRDGTICEAEYSVVANVEAGIHLWLFRDATERRQAERLTQQRQSILEALVRMPAASTLAALADAACQAMVVPGGFSQVAIIAVEPPSRIAIVGAAMDPVTRAVGLPPVVEGPAAKAIIAKADAGAWVDDWSDPQGEPSRTLVEGVPIAAVAWAPIKADGRVIALLVVGGPVLAVEQEQRLPDLVDLASIVAGSTLGRSLREHSTRVASRGRIQEILDAGAFQTVFQPLVDLASGQVIGYEALTRFDDGTAPDVVFAESAAAGMSMDLEIATARAALRAADVLPANRAIDLNVSPELILAREPLRAMLRESGFGVVLEITEHSQVIDYAALRAAIAELGPEVHLADDDAGAGFASLRHILELRPSLVKLDISLIRGIESDLARQGLVAGMVHFATRLGFSLLAEGVETQAERATLLELGVTRAQGYLFGRPAAV